MKLPSSVIAIIFIGAGICISIDDTELAQSKERDYCDSVDLWNKTSDSRFYDQSESGPNGHPDYKNMYDTICGDHSDDL